ncbi:MAG: acyl-CoA dehydrogenase family protein [Myxococcota bacterium]
MTGGRGQTMERNGAERRGGTTENDEPAETGDQILAAARKLGPLIRAEAAAIEAAGRLPEKIVSELKRAGVFRMTMPRSLGGPEVDPIAQLEIVEEVARADGSAGWIVMIGSDGGFYAAHLELEVARRVYADRDAITASVLVPRGRAERVEGGYRVTGQWPFGSASLHADWFVGGCVVCDASGPITGANGHPLVRMTFFPRSDVEILDTWQTTGLAGSGSHDWRVAGAFVPDELAFSLFEPATDPAPLYAFPWFIVANAPGASLGIARAAIEVLAEVAGEKVIQPGGHRLRDELLIQRAIAQSEATLGSARSYLVDMTGRLWRTVEAGDPPSLAERAAFRLAGIHAFRAAKTAVSGMYEAAGGSALYRRSPLDRLWRDISTISQHAFANEKGYAEVGRAMLGLDPQSLML